MGKANPELNARRRRARRAAQAPGAVSAEGIHLGGLEQLDVDALIPPTDLPDNWENYKQKQVVDVLDRMATLLRGVLTHGQLRGAALAAALADGDPRRYSFEAIKRWMDGNIYGFRERFETAERAYAERVAMTLSARALNAESGEKWDNLPALAILNAYMPERFTNGRGPLDQSVQTGLAAIGVIGRQLKEEMAHSAAKAEEEARSKTSVERWLESAPVSSE